MNETRPLAYKVTLLRHGESVGNVETRWQGQSDYPLTDTGRTQTHALAERWKREHAKFDWVITSPLIRAKETAEIVAAALNLTVECDPLWMERDSGEFSGMTALEVRKMAHPEFHTPYDPVGVVGEGDWELFLRAGLALHNLLKRPPGSYLIVSHGGMLNQFMHAVLGVTPQANSAGVRFRFDNTSFARLTYFPHHHRWAIDVLNDHGHWNGKGSESLPI